MRVIPLLALALSNCMLLSGKCLYEVRSLQAAGRLDVTIPVTDTNATSSAELVSARINLSEQREQDAYQFIYWFLTGPTLKGHVLSAAFKDASNPSVVLLDLPIVDASQIPIAEGIADSRMGPNLDGFFELIAAGRGTIELQTDSPSRPTITVPLTATDVQPFVRPNCS